MLLSQNQKRHKIGGEIFRFVEVERISDAALLVHLLIPLRPTPHTLYYIILDYAKQRKGKKSKAGQGKASIRSCFNWYGYTDLRLRTGAVCALHTWHLEGDFGAHTHTEPSTSTQLSI